MEEDRRARERKVPEYDLESVRHAFAEGRFESTRRVRRHLYRKRRDPEWVRACIGSLGRTDFHKSQEHECRPDVWLDIYRPHWRGERLYVKFVLHEDEETYLVLTFCIDGEQH